MGWIKEISILSLLSLAGLSVSSPVDSDAETHTLSWTLDQVLHPALPHLDTELTESLCKTVGDKWVPNRHRFLWTEITSEKETPAKEETTLGCTKFAWTPCTGKPRSPLPGTCGFFNILRLPSDQCQNERTKRSVDAPILIDHARAMELCLLSSARKKETKSPQAKFVPIRVDVDEHATNYPSLYCVGWKYTPCQSGADSTTSKCDTWTMDIQSSSSCQAAMAEIAASENTTLHLQGEEYKELSGMTMDFIQEKKNKPEETKELTGSSGLELLLNLISCSRNGASVKCEVSPKAEGEKRSKREVEGELEVRRTKRQYCDEEGCFGGGGRYSGSGYGYRPYHSARWRRCNCGYGCPIRCTSARDAYGGGGCGSFCDSH